MSDLTPREIDLLRTVFRRHPEIERVCLFGSRATGTNRPESDVDLVAWGALDAQAQARIAAELDELPLPYLFDFEVYDRIAHEELRRIIDGANREVYPRS